MSEQGYLNFTCRVCGSHSYEAKTESRGLGGPAWTEYYFCSGCSTIFKDVAKFSVTPIETVNELAGPWENIPVERLFREAIKDLGTGDFDEARKMFAEIKKRSEHLLEAVAMNEEQIDGAKKDNKKTCSKCGGPIICRYVGDTGSVDHYHTFKHTCQKCGYEENFDSFSCGGQETSKDTEREQRGGAPCLCPRCG